MLICYLDESGSPEAGGTSHFILLGFALPASVWKERDGVLATIKRAHRLDDGEVHTAWMLRLYPEQQRIPRFESLSDNDRRHAVDVERRADIAKAPVRGEAAVQTARRNFRRTADYTHLTPAERLGAVRALASTVGGWADARLFADASLKSSNTFSPEVRYALAFEQVVAWFHHYLDQLGGSAVGLLVQDNNPTAATQLTSLMRRFHVDGTRYASIPRIVETPLFVDSALTGMVQIADLCAYAVRRFFERGESDLFDRIYTRFDRAAGRPFGLRHVTGETRCACLVCTHRRR